jgi:Tfp pilus assembly protein PilF
MKTGAITQSAVLVLILGGCQTAPVQSVLASFNGSAKQELATGLKHYEDGNYEQAERSLRAGLEDGLPATSDQVTARKHLAFIYCMWGRRALCRDEFRRALRVDPSFTLAASEAGHPMWGPVFRSVKTRTGLVRNEQGEQYQ